ncbi:MAG: hypothetical protein ACFFD1_16390, partial [Candidatus Thorarchaeota archaeon]
MNFKYPMIIFLILIMILELSAQNIGQNSKNNLAAIYGRVWGPDNVPCVEAHIIVCDENLKYLYGEDISLSQHGRDDGNYQITKLPSNEKLIVYVFHPKYPGTFARQKIWLKANDYRNLNLKLNLDHTDPGFISMNTDQGNGTLGLVGFITRISTLLLQSQNIQIKKRTIAQLKSLQENSNLYSAGLVAYYPFNGNAKDESGNGNDGVIIGASATKDRFGTRNSAYSFDGVDDYIEVADSRSLNFTNSFTISAWYLWNGIGDRNQFIVS